MANAFTNDIDIVAMQFLSMPTVTFLCEQGDLTVTEVKVSQSGGKDKARTFASPVTKGDLVVMHTVDLVVKKRTTETTVLGVAHVEPEPLEGIELTEYTTVGVYSPPTNREQVVVEVFGLFLRTVTMASGQTAVLGNSVKYSATEPNNFDAAAAAGNGTYVIQGGVGGDNVAVVFNHQGVLT